MKGLRYLPLMNDKNKGYTMTRDVTLIEVGPRDGLQNEAVFVDTSHKIHFINALSQSGLSHIEVTSFVSPKFMPQMQDNTAVIQRIDRHPDCIYSALVPNLKGMMDFLNTPLDQIAIFTAASDTFNHRNIHCSIDESIQRFIPVIEMANTHKIPVRAYVSCVLGCPYEGHITPKQVIHVTEKLLHLGVHEISFGDTIGVGTPKQTKTLIKHLKKILPIDKIALHFHDTYGQAVANIYASLSENIRRFDASTAGLGGCPYANGATGNVATEDILYLMHGQGLQTGVDIYKVVEAGDYICKKMNKKNQSKVANALLSHMELTT
jgi:hydroxymethylglutaryl-CoA lyase